MNLSLLVIFLLVLIIIVLVWLFFGVPSAENNKKPEEANSGISEIKAGNPLRQKTLSSLIDPSLLYPVLEKAEKINVRQKELSFESIIHIVAPAGENFMGYTLLQSLQNTGMRFGARGLFYYDDQSGVVFTVAPMLTPPVFDIEKIGAFKTSGLVLTLNNRAQWDVMQNIANQLSEELGGEVRC